MKTAKIPGYSRYTVTQCGQVFGVRGRRLKPHINHYGYPCVSVVSDANKRTTAGIHRLVALAWIPNPDSLPVVDHRNGDRADHAISNLRWVTQKENMRSAYRDRGQPSAILSQQKADDIRDLLEKGAQTWEIAKLYGVKTGTIAQIKRGQSWQAT